MVRKARIILIIILGFYSFNSNAQNIWDDWQRKAVDKFFGKTELPNGTIDPNGNRITHVYSPTTLDNGSYKVTILEGENNIYQIEDTEIYLNFSSYLGYLGYKGKEGVLVVKNYSSYFYINPDNKKKDQLLKKFKIQN